MMSLVDLTLAMDRIYLLEQSRGVCLRRGISKATTVSKIKRGKRMKFFWEKKAWSINENWKKVILSDETQVVIGKNRKIYIWRKDEEKYLPKCVGQYGDFERKNSIGVMFWGCVYYSGVGTLFVC